MSNAVIISSDIGSQKCCVPLEEFSKIDCQVGCPVKVSTSHGTYVCKVYPRVDLQNNIIVENTVELYKQQQKFLLTHPLYETHHHINKLPVKAAKNINITVVASTFKDVCALKNTYCIPFIRSLLSSKVVAPLSSVSVKSCHIGGIEKILVLDVQPNAEALTINSKTAVTITSIITSKWMQHQEKVCSVRLGGMDEPYNKLKELVVYPMLHPEVFIQLKAPRSILLSGPSGCGKSALVQQLCAENDLFLITVTCSDLSSSDPGGSEEKLRTIFKESQSMLCQSILFLDGIDSICPKHGNQTHTNRLIHCLTTLIDEIGTDSKLSIIAATNRIEDVNPSLRRPGRLDREIHISIPNPAQRHEIIKSICQELALKSTDQDLLQVAEMTPGYVGADLDLLCLEALYASEDRESISMKDWRVAIGRVRASVMRGNEASTKLRKVTWDEVGGLSEAKMYIRRSIEWPLKHPEAFKRLNVPRPKGVLIYGPPGCGKSLLVRAAASSCAASFISISAAELFSPFVGDSEKMVSDLFRRARQAVPAILFLDELDAMVGGRSNASHGRTAQLGVVATLLQEMDGISTSDGVVVVGATNRPDKIDNALLRPGRFDSLVYIPHPDEAARLAVLRSLCRKMPLKNIDLDWLSKRTELFSGADLESLTKEAALSALEEDLSACHIEQQHFVEALNKVPPSLSVQQVEFYTNYASGKNKVR